MSGLNSSRTKLFFLGACMLLAVTFAQPAIGQSGPSIHVSGADITGFPEDWSQRYVVFSNIGTEEEAIRRGDYDHWQKVVNNPSYVVQRLKNHRELQGPIRGEAEYWSQWPATSDVSPWKRRVEMDNWLDGRDDDDRDSRWHHRSQSTVKRDWSQALGGAGLADGQYPAKYDYSTTTATCTDYVTFPTGVNGSATQATIVAFNSVYSGCPLYSGGPVVYWAYNTGTGSKATTSPVLSWDGNQVAFVQTNGTTASLVLLKMAASGGTVSAPAAATSVTTANYRACTSPCFTAISLGANDTTSAPFYVFEGTLADTIYVGDDTGKVHEVKGAFNGTPALDGTSGWPVTASTQTHPALSSPIYDSGGSNSIFVTDAGGYLHSFAVTAPPGTVSTSGRLENNTTNIFGPPLVDGTTERVYVFVGYSGDTGNPSYINYFTAGAVSSFGTAVKFGNGGTTNPATSHMAAGTFDDQYYEGNGSTGHLYVCENGRVYQIAAASGGLGTGTPATFSTPVSTVGTASACSPVTEFLGTKAATTLSAAITTTNGTSVSVTSGAGIATNDYIKVDSEIMKVTAGGGTGTLTVTRGVNSTTAATHSNGAATQDVQDWIFLSVQGNGNATVSPTCSGACVYNYNVTSSPATGNPVDGLGATGGTSGIVIDTSSMAITGDEEIYYTQLGGTVAVQASQAALQ